MKKTLITPSNLIRYIRIWWNTPYIISVFTLILRGVFLNRCSRHFSRSTSRKKRYVFQILNKKEQRTVTCKCENAGNAFGCLAKILLLCCEINDSTLKMINYKVRCSLFACRKILPSLHASLIRHNPLIVLYSGAKSSFSRNERSTLSGCENPSSCRITWWLRIGLEQVKGWAKRTLSPDSENVMNRAIKTWNSQL